MKKIPIKAARNFGDDYNQDQVIIISYQNRSNKISVVTWGRSLKDCKQAAEAGNGYKKGLGFPPDKCHDVPARIKRLKTNGERFSV